MKMLIEKDDKKSLLLFADEMKKSVYQLSGLLDNLLDWAMQQQGHFTANPEKLPLKQLVEEMTGSLNNMAMAKQIELSTDIPEEINLLADRNTTVTILRNLTNNAIKFTPEGGRVKISASMNGRLAEVRVTDTGLGIPQKKMEELFKLQEKKSTFGTKGEKGLGLGLQLVKEFMDLNKGSIRVESVEQKGTTFILHFPRA
jgi:signal transduction histidine kinase